MTESIDKTQIQACILRPFSMPRSSHHLLHIANEKLAQAKKLIRGQILEKVVTVAQWDLARTDEIWQIGFTFAGLRKLYPDYGQREKFLDRAFSSFEAFREGALKRRERLEKDDGKWEFDNCGSDDVPDKDVHLAIAIFHREPLPELEHQPEQYWDERGLTLVKAVQCKGLGGERVHFGYRDNISQPTVAGDPCAVTSTVGPPPVPAWTLVLQQCDQAIYNLRPFPESEMQADDNEDSSKRSNHFYNNRSLQLLLNGSFSAFQKQEQDVQAFEAYLTKASVASGLSRELIAAKFCGRWRNGTPLALAPDEQKDLPDDQLNEFNYNPNDLKGRYCPQGAHIRRMNPRGSVVAGTVNAHRIMRHGMPYGPPFDPSNPDDEHNRGLAGHFIGANLEQQFEFLMKVWANRGEPLGMSSNEKDPLIGDNDKETSRFTMPDADCNHVLKGFGRFVTTKGRVYLFLPSIKALRILSESRYLPRLDELRAVGKEPIELEMKHVRLSESIITEAAAYNGQVPGPVLRLRKGDSVAIRNGLGYNETLPHVHGKKIERGVAVVKSDGRYPWKDVPFHLADGPFRPGEAKTFKIDKKSEPGTYSYSQGRHTAIDAGLLGMLIVQDDDGVAESYNEEICLVFQAKSLDEVGTIEDYRSRLKGDHFLVNGALFPKWQARRVTVRFRVLNATNYRRLNFGFKPEIFFKKLEREGWKDDHKRLDLGPGETGEIIVDMDLLACKSKENNGKAEWYAFNEELSGTSGDESRRPEPYRDWYDENNFPIFKIVFNSES